MPTITRPPFFLLKHPDTNVTLKVLGTHHELRISKLPSWCIASLTNSDVLFHEGRDGVVFSDPFKTHRALKSSYHGECHDWTTCLTDEEIDIAKEVVRLFYKHVRGQEDSIPKLNEIRAWAIEQIALHSSFFATGEEIDYVLHQSFQKARKPVIDLDTKFLAGLTKLIDQDEKHRVSGTLINNGFLKSILAESKIAFDCARTNTEIPVDEDDDHSIDFSNISIDNFSAFVECDIFFSRDDQEMIHGRNDIWLSYIHEFLKEFSGRELSCAVVCGAAHLPDLFYKLMIKGFTILEINADGTTSKFSQKVANSHIEKIVYRQLRAQVTGTDPCFNWLQMFNNQATPSIEEDKLDISSPTRAIPLTLTI